MKKVVYGVLFLALLGMAVAGCQKEGVNPVSQTSSSENLGINQESKDLNLFVSNMFNTEFNGALVVETDDKIHISLKKMNYNVQKSNFRENFLAVDTRSDEGVLKFNSIIFDSSDEYNDGKQYSTSIVKMTNDVGFESTYEMVFEIKNQLEYEILSFELLNGNGAKANWFSRYGDCIGRLLDTDGYVGKVITIGGIAGGVGCGACGAAAGVIFGFGALGCTAV